MKGDDSPARKPWSNSIRKDISRDPHAVECKTWHKVGWSQRCFHTTQAMNEEQQQPASRQQSASKPAQLLCTHQQQIVQPVVAHTHSCTYMHSHKQSYTYRTTVMKHWVPGKDGAQPAVLNTEGLCDEMNMRLLNVDQTLLALLAESQAKAQLHPLPGSTEAAKQQLCDSLENQLAFSTAVLLDWCGATPAGSCEKALQQLTART